MNAFIQWGFEKSAEYRTKKELVKKVIKERFITKSKLISRDKEPLNSENLQFYNIEPFTNNKK